MNGLQKTSYQVDGQFPMCFISNTSSTKTNAVRQGEWQIDLMPGQNNPLMVLIKCCAVEENYYVDENNKGERERNVWFFDFFPAVINNSTYCREMFQSWLCHQQDNHSLDFY